MDYHAHKVKEAIFKGFLNGDKESLTLNTLQNLFNEMITDFSDKWILILDDQSDCDDFNVRSGARLSGHKYCILLDYVTESRYRIGIPNPGDMTSIENRQKSIIIYKRQDLHSENIDTLFQKYLKNNKSNYIVSDLKYILINTFSLLFQQKKRYFQTMQSRSDSKVWKKNYIEFEVDCDIDDVFVSYNVDENSIENIKESVKKKTRNLYKIQNVNRIDILLKDYSNEKLIHFINVSLGIFDLMRAINEYLRGDASVCLEWKYEKTLYFRYFNSTLLNDFKDTTISEDNLKLVWERISEKLEKINEATLQFKELSNSQNKFSCSILPRKRQARNGFTSLEFKSKESLFKLKAITKVIFSVFFSQIGKFIKKHYRNFIVLVKKPWFHIPLAYVILSILSALFQALFNGNIKPSDFVKWFTDISN